MMVVRLRQHNYRKKKRGREGGREGGVLVPWIRRGDVRVRPEIDVEHSGIRALHQNLLPTVEGAVGEVDGVLDEGEEQGADLEGGREGGMEGGGQFFF